MRRHAARFALPGLAGLALVSAAHCASSPPSSQSPFASSLMPSASPMASAAPANQAGPPPVTPRRPVIDEYWGQKVVDEYRWLEDSGDADVKAWSDAENAYARRFLDATPHYADIHARVEKLLGHKSPDYFALAQRGGQLFAMKDEPPKQQPFLVIVKSMAKPEDGARVLVDPNAIDPSGTTTIDWFVPSLDGKLVAVSLSAGGTERGDVHVFDTASGKERGDVIVHAHGGTAGGSLAWNADGNGFYYTRYPHAGERPPEDLDFYQQLYFHKLGDKPENDRYVLGKDFPRIAEIKVESSDDGRTVLVQVENGDGNEFMYFVGQNNAFTKLADYTDKVVAAELGHDGRVYLISHQGAPRGKVLRVAAQRPSLASAETLLAEGEGSIDALEVTRTKLWVKTLIGGPSQLSALPLDGAANAKRQPVVIAIAPVSRVSDMVHLDGDRIVFRNESYVAPPAWFEVSGAKPTPEKTGMAETSPADYSDIEVTVTACSSKDGTRVPMSIVRKKDVPKPAPTVLYGYGGYAVSTEPRFRVQWRTWLEQGGTYAVANIRGGAELGEAWHDQGKLIKKQNVFDDFAACAELLSREHTTRDKLAIMGRSNGGLLMGAELTQHPEMFRAVVSMVGIYDMLRVELAPNGAFNVTEFGTVKDKSQFEALAAYSPFHHVKNGVAYPAVLMTTGANDPRVAPYHSRKMIARLQAASSSGLPVLLRTSASTGHGMGTPLGEAVAEETDVLAFLFTELAVPYKPTP